MVRLANHRSTICTLTWGTIHVLYASEHNGQSCTSLSLYRKMAGRSVWCLRHLTGLFLGTWPLCLANTRNVPGYGLAPESLEHCLLLGMTRLDGLEYLANCGYDPV